LCQQHLLQLNTLFKIINMSDIGRIPLWMVATVGGLAAGGLIILFVFGSYSGLGSSL
jgi:photosystem II PsbJ protein